MKKNIFQNLKILKLGMPKKMAPQSQAKIKSQFTHTLFHTKKNISQVTMRFLTPTHIHIFLHFLIQKNP